jgi:hypothetical protein
MVDPSDPILRCEAYGCTAAYPPDEDIETYVALHYPSGAHGLHERPLTEEQLRSIVETGTLTLEVAEPGTVLARLVFLCDHHAEVGLEFQRTGVSPPLVLDSKRAGLGKVRP